MMLKKLKQTINQIQLQIYIRCYSLYFFFFYNLKMYHVSVVQLHYCLSTLVLAIHLYVFVIVTNCCFALWLCTCVMSNKNICQHSNAFFHISFHSMTFFSSCKQFVIISLLLYQTTM